MDEEERRQQVYVINISEESLSPGLGLLTFHTNRGNFTALAHLGKGLHQGVIMLGDASGSFSGPGSLFALISDDLFKQGIASLRLDYRLPGECRAAAVDALIAAQYLDDECVNDLVAVGWSFGASVAIALGALGRRVHGVAALALSEAAGCCLRRLRSKPVLLIHGSADKVSPPEVSRRIYDELDEPRRLLIYPGVGHTFAEARERLISDLRHWITDTLLTAGACPHGGLRVARSAGAHAGLENFKILNFEF